MYNTPYVISRGLKSIIKKWCKQNNFIAPKDIFFVEMSERLENKLKSIFPQVEIISHREISAEITKIVTSNKLTPISLDRIYFQSQLNLDVTRKMLPNNGKYVIGNRFGTPPLIEQLQTIENSGVREVVLIDDVLFSGGTLISIIKKLNNIGVNVKLVCAGIGIKKGIKNVQKYCPVECFKVYNEVIDEICNWDFYPGVPLSGRLIADSDNIGKPYCEPFGDIVNWASIPVEHADDFSQFLIRESIRLFDEIEKLSFKKVLCSDLERKVHGMPTDKTRFVIALEKHLHK